MEKAINVIAAIICIVSVIFNWGYYFGQSDENINVFKEKFKRLESENDRNQEDLKNIENQVSYIRGILSTQSNYINKNYNVDNAIQASAKINLPPEKFNQIFSTINSMLTPEAKTYLKEKAGFSDEQIKSILDKK